MTVTTLVVPAATEGGAQALKRIQALRAALLASRELQRVYAPGHRIHKLSEDLLNALIPEASYVSRTVSARLVGEEAGGAHPQSA